VTFILVSFYSINDIIYWDISFIVHNFSRSFYFIHFNLWFIFSATYYLP